MNPDKVSLGNIFEVTYVSICFRVLQGQYQRLTLVKKVDRFGLMMSDVEVVSQHLRSASLQDLELITVIMAKMRM